MVSPYPSARTSLPLKRPRNYKDFQVKTKLKLVSSLAWLSGCMSGSFLLAIASLAQKHTTMFEKYTDSPAINQYDVATVLTSIYKTSI